MYGTCVFECMEPPITPVSVFAFYLIWGKVSLFLIAVLAMSFQGPSYLCSSLSAGALRFQKHATSGTSRVWGIWTQVLAPPWQVFYPSSYSVVLKVEGGSILQPLWQLLPRKQKVPSVGWDVERPEPPHSWWGWHNCYSKKYGDPKMNFKRVVMCSSSLISGYIPQTIENNDSNRHLCIRIHRGIIQEAKR